MHISTDLRQFEGYQITDHTVLYHHDLKAINTEDAPNEVTPRTGGNAKLDAGFLEAVLPKHSFHVVRLAKVN